MSAAAAAAARASACASAPTRPARALCREPAATRLQQPRNAAGAAQALSSSRRRAVLARAVESESEEGAAEDAFAESKRPKREETTYVWRSEEEEEAIKGLRADVEELGPEGLAAMDKLLGEGKSFSPGEMAELLGLGLWRLKGALDPKLEVCAAQVEAHLREYLSTELHLGPIDPAFRFNDSLERVDPEMAKTFTPDHPAKGEPGYPRFLIENRVYGSRVFRKIHMELATRQDGMQIFHFVMYPFETFDVPIFSLDMVSFNGNLTLAVADCCPARGDMSLPGIYRQALATISQEFNMPRVSPEWGKDVFSDLCVLIRPTSPLEVGSFIKYVISALTVHLKVTQLVEPVPASQSSRLADIKAAHERYSTFMLKNDKTKKALEASFGADFAGQYMQFMFDTAPAA